MKAAPARHGICAAQYKLSTRPELATGRNDVQRSVLRCAVQASARSSQRISMQWSGMFCLARISFRTGIATCMETDCSILSGIRILFLQCVCSRRTSSY